jgi:hypothetical protein
MGQQIIGVLMLFAVGAIVADLVIHPEGTGVLTNGIARIWQSGLNASLGQTSQLP